MAPRHIPAFASGLLWALGGTSGAWWGHIKSSNEQELRHGGDMLGPNLVEIEASPQVTPVGDGKGLPHRGPAWATSLSLAVFRERPPAPSSEVGDKGGSPAWT